MKTIEWINNRIRMLDQTRLPQEEVYLYLDNYRGVVKAIKEMRIRGAPALGVIAAYGAVLGALEIDAHEKSELSAKMERVFDEIASSRPTAVNIVWALDRMKRVLESGRDVEAIKQTLLEEAREIR
jgi:methylthioribose-1-phosphate isomerase